MIAEWKTVESENDENVKYWQNREGLGGTEIIINVRSEARRPNIHDARARCEIALDNQRWVVKDGKRFCQAADGPAIRARCC